MNQTWYDTRHKIASIQPGSNWGRVYEALDRYQVTAVGGRASPVGVGGFITGGGVSSDLLWNQDCLLILTVLFPL
jgi:FAD/FMN-containing dehydrogenase